MFSNHIYLDNNSTTPIDKRVLRSMQPFLGEYFGNAASSYDMGAYNKQAVEKARKDIASLLNTTAKEIVFTSGATESINLVLKGVTHAYKKDKKNHIITAKTEHKAVLETCKFLSTQGIKVTYLDVDKNGIVDLEQLKKALNSKTILVCIMLANNETGVIQPFNKIKEIVKAYPEVFLMTDATAAVGKMLVDVQQLGVDFLSFSSHKVYGPKGVGALYINRKRKSKMTPLIHGGGQEENIRGGTVNVPGIVGFGKACSILKTYRDEDVTKLRALRKLLEEKLVALGGIRINGGRNRICNVLNISIGGVNNYTLLEALKRTRISLGSACSSLNNNTQFSSHVLESMHLPDARIKGAVRISLGRFNTERQILSAYKELEQEIKRLRKS